MDSGSEPSVEDNELVETERLEKNGEIDTKLKDNGKCDAEDVDRKLSDDMKAEDSVGKTTEILKGGSDSIGSSPAPSPATKGRGLRKWRRIRREAGKETNTSLDSNRKRGMAALPAVMKQRSEGSSSSTNAMSNVLDHNLLYGDLGQGPDFASRVDSDNSEDQNSRSSTAASAPRRNKVPIMGLETNTMSSPNGKNPGNSVEPSDDNQEKSRSQTKKARGFKPKKQNSISSLESDSRSSNFVFTQGSNSMTSNGRQSGKLGNYEEDYSDDDAQNGDPHLKEEAQNQDLAAENSWKVKEEKNDEHDALVESIMPLHLAQQALEREVQKLKDVGKQDTLSSDDSFQSINIKNTKISDLESILNLGDINTEYEELWVKRIAAELEYLVISKTIQNLKEGHMDEIKFTVQQKKVAAPEKVQVEDAWKLRNRVCRYGLCFMIQLILLLVVVYVIFLRFSSQRGEVVIPT